jgi:hypothetical protein
MDEQQLRRIRDSIKELTKAIQESNRIQLESLNQALKIFNKAMELQGEPPLN